jgi:5-methylcytosine-specific restriction protein A
MTGRTVPEWIGATPDAVPPPRVRLRVFERHEGRCHRSGRKIRAGEPWQCDHVVAIINGGENRESNLAPILTDPHREKTAEDVAIKSKTARIAQKHRGVFPKSKFTIRSRGFQGGRG